MSSINNSTKYINDLYDNLTYFDLYGSSVIQFILFTLFVFLIYSYCKILQVKEDIANDWVNQRCKPQNIPFAGWITKPEGVSAFQYTGDNFQFCMQNILVNMTGYVVQPITYLMDIFNNIFKGFSEAINNLRNMLSTIRQNTRLLAEDLFNRILNMVIPIQQIFIALIDSLNKTQGILTAGLYTMLGSYYTLQSLMGAILELVIKILITLVAVIVGLWVVPFTWPAAATMSAVFLAVAIPMSIIVYFMTEVLHIHTSAIPKLRCFDKDTLITMNDNSTIPIQNIKPGDILQHNVCVTSTMKVDSSGLRMFDLRNIIVSESHILHYNDKWIPVKNHPEAVEIFGYDRPYLYCFNTSSKQIIINGLTFTDWDEIYDDELLKITRVIKHNNNVVDMQTKIKNIDKCLDNGFDENVRVELKGNTFVPLKEIKIGDTLSNGGIVYGLVEIDKNNIMSHNLGNIYIPTNKLFHLLVSNKFCKINNAIVHDYNYKIDKYQ